MSKKNICSILFYEGHISFSPTIINLARNLNQHGYQVNIYAGRPELGKVGEMGEIETITFPTRKISQILNKVSFRNLRDSIIFAVEIIAEAFKSKRYSIFDKKNIFIVTDICGSLVALFYFYIFKINYLILSLELYEVSKSSRKLMRLACIKSKGIIIQDEDRYKSFCNIYGYQHSKVFFLPNSPMPVEKESNVCDDNKKENYFIDKFNLDETKFPNIILSAGAIGDHVLSKVLAISFASIDNGCALVFHSRAQKSENNPDIKPLIECNPSNLFLSLEPVAYDDIGKIYASSTIGIAMYSKDLGDNYTNISKASGKLAEYTKYGKPVLVNDLPSLVELVTKYNCGLVIRDPSNPAEISGAIEKIMDSYEWYSSNAKSCYESEFDFGKNVQQILNYVDAITEIE